MSYSEKLLELFHHPKHVGELGGQCRVGQAGLAENGDVVKLSLRIAEDRVEKARFQVAGGVVAIALAEYVCQWVEGKQIADCLCTPEKLLRQFELPENKLHIAQLICQSLSRALT